jgi:hypothetical protein
LTLNYKEPLQHCGMGQRNSSSSSSSSTVLYIGVQHYWPTRAPSMCLRSLMKYTDV